MGYWRSYSDWIGHIWKNESKVAAAFIFFGMVWFPMGIILYAVSYFFNPNRLIDSFCTSLVGFGALFFGFMVLNDAKKEAKWRKEREELGRKVEEQAKWFMATVSCPNCNGKGRIDPTPLEK